VSSVKSVEQFVICKPVAATGITREKDDVGFTQLSTKMTLNTLEVAAESEFKGLKAGDKIYVTAESAFNALWTKNVFQLEGKPVIIVPSGVVVAIDRA